MNSSIKQSMNDMLEEYLEKRGISINPHSGSKVPEEARELVDAIALYYEYPTEENLFEVYYEMADVVLSTAGIARKFGVTIEDCINLKIIKDTGRGYKNQEDALAGQQSEPLLKGM